MSENAILWLKATRERRTSTVHAITYGVECSRCRCFQEYETRFCKDCGGRYDGPLPIFNKYAERKRKTIEQALKMRADGKSLREIAEALDDSIGSLGSIRKEVNNG